MKNAWRFLLGRFREFIAEAAKARRYMLEDKRQNMAKWEKSR